MNEPRGIFSNYVVFKLTSGENVSVWAIDDTVVLIEFAYDLTGDPIGITFGECIKELGDPELAVQYEVFGDKILYIIPVDGSSTEFSVISPSNGFLFDTNTGHKSDINANTKISSLSYFDVKSYDKLYSANRLMYFDLSSGAQQPKLWEWQGYGNIDVLYPQSRIFYP